MGTEICSCYGIYRKYFAETNFFPSFRAEEVQYTESDISYYSRVNLDITASFYNEVFYWTVWSHAKWRNKNRPITLCDRNWGLKPRFYGAVCLEGPRLIHKPTPLESRTFRCKSGISWKVGSHNSWVTRRLGRVSRVLKTFTLHYG